MMPMALMREGFYRDLARDVVRFLRGSRASVEIPVYGNLGAKGRGRG